MLERAGSSGRAMRFMDRLIEMRLPVIGDKPVNSQVQILLALLVTCLLLFVLVLFIDNRAAANGAMQIEIVGDTLMHTQRLAKAAPNAVGGNRSAFTEVKESRDAIAGNLEALMKGDEKRDLSATGSDTIKPELEKLLGNWRASESAASVILGNEKILLAFGDVIKKINDASPRLQQLTEEIMALKLQVGAPSREIATAGQLVTLTQRLGKSANSLVAGNIANAEVALNARPRYQSVSRFDAGAAFRKRCASRQRGDGYRGALAAAGAAEGVRRISEIDRRRSRQPAGDRASQRSRARHPARF